MFKALVILGAAASVCAFSAPRPAASRALLIAGGEKAEPGEFPFLVNIRQGQDESFCGGSILSDRWVLTAAHCLHKEKPQKLRVQVGHVHRERGQSYRVKAKYMHPKYNHKASSDNDIALLELDSPIAFGEHVAPVGLYPVRLPARSLLTLAGWGGEWEKDEEGPTRAKTVVLEMGTPAECAAAWKKTTSKKDRSDSGNFICAGGNQWGESVCGGDSGGPAVVNVDGYWLQAGVVSFGSKACQGRGNWEFFADVSQYLPWIAKTTGSTVQQLTQHQESATVMENGSTGTDLSSRAGSSDDSDDSSSSYDSYDSSSSSYDSYDASSSYDSYDASSSYDSYDASSSYDSYGDSLSYDSYVYVYDSYRPAKYAATRTTPNA